MIKIDDNASSNGSQISPLGDSTLLITFGSSIDPAINNRVHAVAAAINALHEPALGDSVPAYAALSVQYDPVRLSYDDAVTLVREAISTEHAPNFQQSATVTIPTLYGGEMGPDVADVAAAHNLTEAEVIARHTAGTYRVYMIGFSPGFSYLGPLDPTLATPRRATPRQRVPAGSVAIGGAQTGVYPQMTPGGWHILGRTPLRLFDPHNTDSPTLLRSGDIVRFKPIDRAEYDSLLPQPLLRPSLAAGENNAYVEEAGGVALVQDAGRGGRGYAALGLPPGGALDPLAFAAANVLVGNEPTTPALELYAAGPSLRFTRSALIALTGADFGATLDERPISHNMAYFVRGGSMVRFRGARNGARAWLAVAGGFGAAHELGSSAALLSAGIGGHAGGGRPLAQGDTLAILPPKRYSYPLAGRTLPASFSETLPEQKEIVVRVVAGPHAHTLLPDTLSDGLYSSEFRALPNSDRMGLRIETEANSPFAGAVAEWRRPGDILSFGVVTGTVQIPPDGRPIILLADRQTTGGYPVIAVVISADIRLLAQATPGSIIRFQPITIAEAQAIYRRQQTDFAATVRKLV